MHSMAKKRLLKKKYKNTFQKSKSTQTSGSVFVDRIEQVKETKFELELIRLVVCFLDRLGYYSSSLVSFKVKSL